MALKRGNEIPTIDVVLVTISVKNADGETTVEEIALRTSSKIAISPQIETIDPVKLIVKGELIAQKRGDTVITGNTIVLTDNVFNPQVVKILQGGNIVMGTGEDTDMVVSYTPPVSGSADKGAVFELCAYSSCYGNDGLIYQYEKITYPNCNGTPISMSSEDGVFRAPEYTINSAPKEGEAPYSIEYVKTLPSVTTTLMNGLGV